MSKGIQVSKKYGVNPTIPICFWCGEEKNEIAMLGKLPGDVEAPKNMWIPGDYDPCEKCKEYWDQGVAMIEADTEPMAEGQPPMSEDIYPTGRFVVIKREAIKKFFTDEGYEKVKEKGIAFVTKDDFQKIFIDPLADDDRD